MAGEKHRVITRHPDRPEIDKALLDGTPLRNIVERYGTSLGALSRYRDDVLSQIPEQVADDPRIEEARENAVETVVEEINGVMRFSNRLDDLNHKIDGVLQAAEKKQDLTAQTSAIREARSLLALDAQVRIQMMEVVSEADKMPKEIRVVLVGDASPVPEEDLL